MNTSHDISPNYLQQNIIWKESADAEFPFRASLDRRLLIIRINDFPAQSLYTLLVDDHPVSDFDDWPESWQKPE